MINVKPVITRLRKLLGQADKIMLELWQMMMSRNSHHQGSESYENNLSDALANTLRRMSNELAIALEMMGLAETRKEFLVKWKQFDEEALRETKEFHDDWGDELVSLPLNLCESIIHVIESTYESDEEGAERAELNILEFILNSTARIVANASVNPGKEADIQKPMNEQLSTTFSSFTSQLTISKPIMSFKPDCGITDLKTAIEYKFVPNKAKLKTAIHGLNEDLSAYAGSLDWTRFYSVIYQTGPFGTEKQVREALRKSGNAERWKVFLVTGSGRS